MTSHRLLLQPLVIRGGLLLLRVRPRHGAHHRRPRPHRHRGAGRHPAAAAEATAGRAGGAGGGSLPEVAESAPEAGHGVKFGLKECWTQL